MADNRYRVRYYAFVKGVKIEPWHGPIEACSELPEISEDGEVKKFTNGYDAVIGMTRALAKKLEAEMKEDILIGILEEILDDETMQRINDFATDEDVDYSATEFVKGCIKWMLLCIDDGPEAIARILAAEVLFG